MDTIKSKNDLVVIFLAGLSQKLCLKTSECLDEIFSYICQQLKAENSRAQEPFTRDLNLDLMWDFECALIYSELIGSLQKNPMSSLQPKILDLMREILSFLEKISRQESPTESSEIFKLSMVRWLSKLSNFGTESIAQNAALFNQIIHYILDLSFEKPHYMSQLSSVHRLVVILVLISCYFSS